MKENLPKASESTTTAEENRGRSRQGNWDHLEGQEVVDKHPRLIVDCTY
jgi:hypothetical protein